jgi:adenylosuccinate synthase
VDPLALMKEIGELEEKGITVKGRLFVSDRSHMIFPYHRALDAGREDKSGAGEKIGTTKRGIGPSYADKASRLGLRMGDLLDASFVDSLEKRIRDANRVLAAGGGQTVDSAEVVAIYKSMASKLGGYITDTVSLLNRALKEKKSILFEGAQGTMLDIDFGTYPFVTSSNATAGGACTGTGIPPNRVDRVVGVIKAYTTRVGEGPFPTELKDGIGEQMREEGGEFGATTGRPRRCGWFDAVVARYSAMINGVDYWAMTKLDVLDNLKTLKICTAYECDGKKYDTIPANIRTLERCKPVYEEMPGWQTSTKDVTRLEDLSPRAKAYVDRLCKLTDVKLGILSVGAKRESTLRVAL